uniref:Uncharacterized protein n=1 Tax=Rangifer tarandus platyrhynchus TaxID=3082113 RepID=A0ACB0DYN7_RANTA|nr:unnamed protein product [Rangifer tarandus platyrhynchus]
MYLSPSAAVNRNIPDSGRFTGVRTTVSKPSDNPGDGQKTWEPGRREEDQLQGTPGEGRGARGPRPPRLHEGAAFSSGTPPPLPPAPASYLSEDEAGRSGAAIGSFQPAPPGRGASGHLHSTHGVGNKRVRTRQWAAGRPPQARVRLGTSSPGVPQSPHPSLLHAPHIQPPPHPPTQASTAEKMPGKSRPRAPTTSINKDSEGAGSESPAAWAGEGCGLRSGSAETGRGGAGRGRRGRYLRGWGVRPVRAPVLGKGGGGHGSQPHGPPVRGGQRTAGPPGRLHAGGGGGRQDFPTRFGTRAGSCERSDTLKGSRRSPPRPQRTSGQRPPTAEVPRRGVCRDLADPSRWRDALSHLASALHQSFPVEEGRGGTWEGGGRMKIVCTV